VVGRSARRSSLQLAAETDGVHSVAFPALSCGVFEYPWDEAADIAVRMCKEVSRPC
jgi:O-acetyl-ADP-ribose deacetylase (regulator of RNase III)